MNQSMTLGIYMSAQLWKSFPEELKTTKQKNMYTNVTGPFREEKK